MSMPIWHLYFRDFCSLFEIIINKKVLIKKVGALKMSRIDVKFVQWVTEAKTSTAEKNVKMQQKLCLEKFYIYCDLIKTKKQT